MTREDAKKFLGIMQAFIDGKDIEYKDKTDPNSKWEVTTEFFFDDDTESYRIKPEVQYRPFASHEECFMEMQNHTPVGWILNKYKVYSNIAAIVPTGIYLANSKDFFVSYANAYSDFTFMDGSPFGMKEEK